MEGGKLNLGTVQFNPAPCKCTLRRAGYKMLDQAGSQKISFHKQLAEQGYFSKDTSLCICSATAMVNGQKNN